MEQHGGGVQVKPMWGPQETMTAPLCVGGDGSCAEPIASPLSESPKLVVASDSTTPAQHKQQLDAIVERGRSPLLLHDDEDEASEVALDWLEARGARYRALDMKALISDVESVEEFTRAFSEAIHEAQELEERATLFVRHVDLLFVLLMHKSSFFPAREHAWNFDEVVELLETLVRFGNVRLVCTATERRAMKGSKSMIARRLSPYVI
ncbi:hypothetical protein FVE85_4018 [Porphyridium purpureum]|uniref:Uncharacterized protein n=1 Tax=Porphyridium purpureum TaxID=35688 RepID=A0A5J4YTE7_PORPP|nr:hypothetical protein FVE85_4018 [Porphyridium purpureum]|eukprot:POR0133..scf229_5